ncbi:MAG TPA: ATPase [Tissierellaceae bacterium]
MDVLKLIDEMEDIIEDGSSVPLTKKVMVDSEEILDIIREIRIRLPDEMQQASWIKEEKERIIGEAEREAMQIQRDTEEKVREMVEDSRITTAAEERAEEILYKAQEAANEIRLGALEYADSLLMNTQEKLQELVELINDNREELRS